MLVMSIVCWIFSVIICAIDYIPAEDLRGRRRAVARRLLLSLVFGWAAPLIVIPWMVRVLRNLCRDAEIELPQVRFPVRKSPALIALPYDGRVSIAKGEEGHVSIAKPVDAPYTGSTTTRPT